MNDKKNIDRLFQEKFKDFEVTPDEAVWEKIKARQNKKRALILPFWYRAAGVAALIAVIFTIGYFSQSTNPTTETVVSNESKDPARNDVSSPENADNERIESDQNNFVVSSNEEEISSTDDPLNEGITKDTNNGNSQKIIDNNPKTTIVGSKQDPSITTKGKTSTPNTKESIIANNLEPNNTPSNTSTDKKADDSLQKNTKIDNADIANHKNQNTDPEKENLFLKGPDKQNDVANPGVTENYANTNQNPDGEEVSNETPEADQNKKSLFDAINQKEEAIAEEKNTAKKWNVTPNVAPVYYDSFGDGSSIDTQFADNNKSGQVNLSYGVHVSYHVNKRLSVRSGVNKVDLSYNTQNIGFSPSSIVGQNLESINYSPNAEVILVSDIGRNQNNQFIASDINREAINLTQNEGLLNQRIGYIEVPLEMKYALVNKKLGVNMIGGVSTLFLQNNEVSIEAGDFETTIGEANNVNDVSFTGNIGIGVDYKLSDQFQINLEPIFKYQFNGFSGNTENFRPYYFGIYTGVSIKF